MNMLRLQALQETHQLHLLCKGMQEEMAQTPLQTRAAAAAVEAAQGLWEEQEMTLKVATAARAQVLL
jgi:hypothetical protein